MAKRRRDFINWSLPDVARGGAVNRREGAARRGRGLTRPSAAGARTTLGGQRRAAPWGASLPLRLSTRESCPSYHPSFIRLALGSGLPLASETSENMKKPLLPLGAALLSLAGLSWLLATTTPLVPAPSPSVNGIPTVPHVIYISCDGLRGDTLSSIITNRPLQFPNFKRLKDGGAFTFRARTDYGFTETIPNHSCMVTGRPVYEPGTTTASGVIGHGMTFNTGTNVTGPTTVVHKLGGSGVYSYRSSVFDQVHDAGGATACFFSKDRMFFLVRSYNGTVTDAGFPQSSIKKIDRASPSIGFPTGAIAVGDAFLADVGANGLPGFTFLHFIDPDTSVHSTAVTTTLAPAALSSYENAILACDTGLGKVFAWLDAHPAEKACTTLILSGDHGGVGGTASHIDATRVENYTIPFFITGPGFTPGSEAYAYFTNRSDPGTVRVTDALTTVGATVGVPNPPLRNGDVANLTCALMGLEAVPGSYFKPIVFNPATHTLLTVAPAAGGTAEVKWPVSATSFALESSPSLAVTSWGAVTMGLATTADSNVHTVPATGQAFFRLRKK
jgi:Type I phosphodiesterase / nucleotide pyrophosphatase